MRYTVLYPTPWEEIDPRDDNMDVCVTFEDGLECTFVFATPRNLQTLMERDHATYWLPGQPFLFVSELTEANIRACLDAISEDPVLRQIYGTQFDE